ncbi:phosphoesterase family-domain-containing protein [Umbelopsis sp. PMI_123]|nr:phosphoesterase family-domain-containing protein [Umbelopsis sp. PMI_123]
MRSLSVICFTALAAAGSVFAQQTTATSTSSAAVATGTATGTTTSSTQGKVFQRFMQIWLENNDFETAASLPQYQAISAQGILLNNTYAITHPSEPNYVAATGGSNFGIDNDDFYNIPANVSSIFDLLEAKGLKWKAYQEDLPSVGYTGFTGHNGSYVRKHDPAIIYDSIGLNATRAANVVPGTQLAADIAAGTVPEWVFYTPNMTNDGHDTTAEFAGNWLTNFFNTTLSNQTFVSETLILITFDENETYSKANRVWSVLLGAIPASSKNTTDGTFYTHYSTLSTVEQNWGLGNLGRGDANTTLANVYSFVASQIGYTNVNIANGSSVSLFNATIPGLLTNQSYNETHPSASGSGAGATATHGSGAARLTTSAVIVSIAGAVAAALML